MNLYLIAAVIAATSFGAAWKTQDWRYQAKEQERVEQQLLETRNNAASAIRRIDSVSAAQSAAAKRLAGLRTSESVARNELDGLRKSTEAANRAASASFDACTGTAATLGRLLNQCGAAYQELGAVADRHVSDIRTLTEAWPQ